MMTNLCSSPIFEPLWPGLFLFKDEVIPSPDLLNTRLVNAPVRFVAQTRKSEHFEEGYEQRVFLKGEVQTRKDSWHDFFNALVWNAFPSTKKEINRLQYELLKTRHPHRVRSPAENMLTLFDENGAIVIAKDESLLELIREHRWHELFWQRRNQTRESLQVIILGHGLYEKALNPYVGMIAQALLITHENKDKDLDERVSQWLKSKREMLRTCDLYPFPVLGVPGWWQDNETEAFYYNRNYFRPISQRGA